mmetsp:Transcript_79496/g.213481  ORF Transcript_79496/g.213481 Transcript_79496/m.213481 type:complete len:367 (-) Transcript_79496:323-1423(-)
MCGLWALVTAGSFLPTLGQQLLSGQDLSDKYLDIFNSGSSASAAHLWSSYILKHATTMSTTTLERLFQSFCPVSGNLHHRTLVSTQQALLQRVEGGTSQGMVHTCCWPCACDLMDFASVDTKTVATLDGARQYDFLVIGNPCQHPEKLEEPLTDPIYGYFPHLKDSMPEVYCSAGVLGGATLSDHGHPIISMFFADGTSQVMANQTLEALKAPCASRRTTGYDDGMGTTTRALFAIAPIGATPASTAADPQAASLDYPPAVPPGTDVAAPPAALVAAPPAPASAAVMSKADAYAAPAAISSNFADFVVLPTCAIALIFAVVLLRRQLKRRPRSQEQYRAAGEEADSLPAVDDDAEALNSATSWSSE